jgi:hypothetical protein
MRNIVCYRTNTNNDNHRRFISPRSPRSHSSSPCNSPRNNRGCIYNLVTDTQCRQCEKGKDGSDGIDGKDGESITGPPGPPGTPGEPGTKINVSNFYALMKGDNSATIAPGTAIEFPNDGVSNNSIITRISASTFNLATVGIYEIFFQVSITEPGQLVIVLNGTELPYTVIGRATGTTQLVCMTIINTTLPDSILSINNVAANATALLLTSNAGGNNAVSGNLIIKQYI